MKETRFKDSEIGRIPEDWEIVKLEDKGTLLRESINPQMFPHKHFVEYSMPSFDNGCMPEVKEGLAMQSSRTCIKSPVLLYNKLNVRQRRIWYIEKCPDDSICSMEFLPYASDKIDLCCLKYFVNTDKVTTDFVGMSKGTSNSQKRIAPSDFLEYKIGIPQSKEEQTRIASALTSIDNLISSLDKLIEKKKAIKEGTMQQLLTGKKRLKGFNGVWKNTSMIDMVDSFNDILDGDWIEAKYLSKTGVRLIQTGNIGEGEYLEKNPKYVTQETFSLLRCREVLPGDLLICRLAEPAGRCCLAPSLHQKMITSVDVTIFRPSNRFDRNFLCYLFNCKEWLEVVAEETRGSTRQRIARKTLENLAIPMPFDKAEQSAIASILFSIDTDIYSLVQKKIKFQKVKQGMMQQLLRGRIRLV